MYSRYLPSSVLWAWAAALPLAAQVSVLTYHNDLARTGQNLAETILTPANVKHATFGKLFLTTLDGKVDAQPLYAAGVAVQGQGTHNVLVVATEGDSLYGLDADSGAQLWHASLLGSGETTSDDLGCYQVQPQIGITSTPVISLNGSGGGAIYAEAMSKDGSGNYHHRLHAIDLTSGSELLGGPVEIQATYPGTGAGNHAGTLTFDAQHYLERAALLLLNGVVYMGWSSHCDHAPYTGWIMGYDATTLAQTAVIDITPNGSRGGIWGSGAGPAADGGGNIYFLDGNGTFGIKLNPQGFPANGNFGNSFLKLSTSGGQLAVSDYFTMHNVAAESKSDEDLGSGGALVLPDMRDAAGTVRHLAIGAGKDMNIYIVNRENMGKFNPQSNNAIYQELTGELKGEVLSMPAYYKGQVYFGSLRDRIKAFAFTNARLSATPVSMTAMTFGYPGATPGISANGAKDGILWAVENSKTTAVLHAFRPENLAAELYNSNQAAGGRDHFGAGNKFITPTIVNGKVYVGTPVGVAAFGLLK